MLSGDDFKLKCPRLNLLEAFNIITIKQVVILNHFQVRKQSFMAFI